MNLHAAGLHLTRDAATQKLNFMVKFPAPSLDLVFAALADGTRRQVLERLGDDSLGLSITELAQPHAMSLTGFMKHLAVLEAAGLITRSKEGRVVRVVLSAEPMQAAADWMARYEAFWSKRLDALGRYLYHEEEVHPWPAPTNAPRSGSAAATKPPRKKSGAPGPTRKR